MAYKLSGALAQSCHNGPGFKSTLQGPDGFFLHLFSGTVPTAPGDALDMVTTHTLLGVCTVNSDGTTGCTFDAAVTVVGKLVPQAHRRWMTPRGPGRTSWWTIVHSAFGHR